MKKLILYKILEIYNIRLINYLYPAAIPTRHEVNLSTKVEPPDSTTFVSSTGAAPSGGVVEKRLNLKERLDLVIRRLNIVKIL
jgi:hypothetical protein